MNRSAVIGVLGIFLFIIGIGISSAYTSYGDYFKAGSSSYSFKAPEVGYVYPSYTNAPTVNQNSLSFKDSSSGYSRNYQGPIAERTTTYDEYLKIGKSGKVLRTISAKTSDKFLGAIESERANAQNTQRDSASYSSSSPNPTSYNGGSYWRYEPSYQANQNNQDSSYSDYYYSPKFDSRSGYYNWRY